jgi:thioredoxin reductase (NADPH)
LIPTSHNYPGFPHGISGIELLELLARQTEFYHVPIVRARITDLTKAGDGFHASFDGGKVSARMVLMATGIVDVVPKIDGLDAAVKEGLVRYCPVCDAFEAADQRIAVIGGEDAITKARFLRAYSKHVTVLWQGSSAPDRGALEAADIAVVDKIAALEIRDKKVWAVTSDDTLSFDVLYPALGCHVNSDLAVKLGAETGGAGCLKVDEHQRTNVARLYAAGDVVSDLHQIAVGTGHAAIAATNIHKCLPAHPR